MRIQLQFQPTTEEEINNFRTTQRMIEYKPEYGPLDWDEYYLEMDQIGRMKKRTSDLARIQKHLFKIFHESNNIEFPTRTAFPEGPEGDKAFADIVKNLDTSWKEWLTTIGNQHGYVFPKMLTIQNILD